MKTTSKLLSMLLLVAMCLSLMGGAAYAEGLATLGGAADTANSGMDISGTISGLAPVSGDDSSSNGSNSGSNNMNSILQMPGEEELSIDDELLGLDSISGIETYSSTQHPWLIGTRVFPSLGAALGQANSGDTIKVNADVELTESVTINKNVTIDLSDNDGSHTLSLNGKSIFISGNAVVTFSNGTIANGSSDIAVVDSGSTLRLTGITAGDPNFGGDGKIQIYNDCHFNKDPNQEDMADGFTPDGGGNTGTYVARIGSVYYKTVAEAIGAANEGDTVTFITDTSVSEDIDANGVNFSGKNNITLDLGGNGLILHGSCMDNANIRINGAVVLGYDNFTLNNSNLTLGSGTSISNDGVTLNGGSITINGGTVSKLTANNATVNMSSGTIESLTAGNSTLNISGGTVNGFTATAGNERAITGGQWKVDATQLEAFKNAIANNYEAVAGNPYYTVRKIGDSGNVGDFKYAVYGSPYTRNSSNPVYVDISHQSENSKYYIATNYNGTGNTALSTNNYSLVSNVYGNYNYRLTLSTSYLNSLSNGTYYLFVLHNNQTTRMGSFVVNGSGDIINGDVAVWPVNENTWYSGDPMLAFYYKPSINSSGIEIDGWTVPGIDWANNNMGTLKLGTSLLSNLSRGWHTLTINTDYGRASCEFYIGATLRPVDTDKHVTGSSKNLQFVCSDPISRVWVGGTELTNYNYNEYFSLSNSRKTITLSAKFLNARTAGETYTLTVQTDNGDQPSCTFQILTRAQASSSPRTGDDSNLALWAAVLLVSGGAAIAVLPRLRKHEN